MRPYAISIIGLLLLGSVVYAAPYYSQEASIVPIDSSENIGTSTNRWAEGHFVQLCISADCKTAWPSGSSFSTTSADFWKDQRNFFSTTSTDYWKTVNNFFSTTSADHWDTTKQRFGTTSISASAPLTWNTGTAALSISQAGSGSDGYLSSAHWNVFNNKISSTSLSATSPLSYNSSSGVFSLSTAGDWTGTLDGFEAAAFERNLTAGDGLTRTADDFDCDTASASVFGCLSSANWSVFNNKISSTSLSSANDFLTYNSTTGIFTASTTPTYTRLYVSTDLYLRSNTTALALYESDGHFGSYGGTSCTHGILSLSALGAATCGGFGYPFLSNATSTLLAFNGGLTAFASSTIGAGTAKTGLTVDGTATTTRNLVVQGLATSTFVGPISSLKFATSSTATTPFGIPMSSFATSTAGTNSQIVFTGTANKPCTHSAAVITCPSNTAYFTVEVWGGGGGGGGGDGRADSFSYAGGGGGSGAYAQVFVLNPSGTYYYTIGTGGTGGLITDNSGGTSGAQSCFGTNSTACTTPLAQAGGGNLGSVAGGGAAAGGTASNGDVKINGQGGTPSQGATGSATTVYTPGGSGAPAPRGGGGSGGGSTGFTSGNAGDGAHCTGGFGGGAGGGGNENTGTATATGGNGCTGGLVITVFTH